MLRTVIFQHLDLGTGVVHGGGEVRDGVAGGVGDVGQVLTGSRQIVDRLVGISFLGVGDYILQGAVGRHPVQLQGNGNLQQRLIGAGSVLHTAGYVHIDEQLVLILAGVILQRDIDALVADAQSVIHDIVVAGLVVIYVRGTVHQSLVLVEEDVLGNRHLRNQGQGQGSQVTGDS
ncbi:MAG: hypothetical protein NC311_10450 [Muribaculaceae bacterium]|nr:hypothetical protein [Muribaculaceae bacterium]